MGCGMGVIKYLLFIFNFIFVLCGLAILIIGVLIHVEDKNYSKEMHDVTGNLTFPAVTLIVIGTIIFLIAFFGCCGAIRESHCMMVTFASLLLVILIIQVAVAIYAFVVLKGSEDIDFVNEYEKNLFSKYRTSNESREWVDSIQIGLSCCGVKGSSDFFNKLQIPPPISCCGKTEGTCTQLFDKGCGQAIKDVFKSGCAILGGVALGIAGIELLGIIFALCLANSIKNAERRGYSV